MNLTTLKNDLLLVGEVEVQAGVVRIREGVRVVNLERNTMDVQNPEVQKPDLSQIWTQFCKEVVWENVRNLKSVD